MSARPARVLASLALAVSGVATTAPADAAAGVLTCSAASYDEVRGTCILVVAVPGRYELTLVSAARYSWARVSCTGTGDRIVVDQWNTDPGYPIASGTGILPGPLCTLTVAAGDEGAAVANLHPAV